MSYGLIFSSLQFFRHGHRAPRKTWPNDPYQSFFEGHLSELTTRGFEAAYRVGRQIRRWYAPLLLGNIPKQVYMRSTNSSRTLATAKAILLGLRGLAISGPTSNASLFEVDAVVSDLEERLGHLLPEINTVPLSEDLMLKRSARCPSYERLYEKVKSKFGALESANRDILQPIHRLVQQRNDSTSSSPSAGEKSGSMLRSAWTLFDSVYSWTMHDMLVPSLLNDSRLVARLRELAALKMRLYFCEDELLRIRSQAIRSEVLSNVAKHAVASDLTTPWLFEKNRFEAKLSLYSTHDSTLTLLLCALRLYSCKVRADAFLENQEQARIPPEFAATVMIDLLLENRRIADSTFRPNYTVQIWYYNPNVANADRIRLKLPSCSERCPVKVLANILLSHDANHEVTNLCDDRLLSNVLRFLVTLICVEVAVAVVCFLRVLA